MECFDVPAPGVGAVCGSCVPGFTGDGLKCTGIDNHNIEYDLHNYIAVIIA